MGEDIGYPIKTTKSGTRGPWDFGPPDCWCGLWGLHAVRTLADGPMWMVGGTIFEMWLGAL